ncbi:hypothetical protein AURDEDRAFT_177938 [Auricularia subglabra TFB-10046 SS5]|uniref:F-box domain-containing protein n=1 Tax=Auricularia subglabra (strain TFB-10046 / SS5) TaxID=717982 RepID=J0D2V5_AURST|nr:hypothetical protein AURDEDRAFT_177938 [Auricularia subglabra TFB-10046 SS5]
MLPQPDDVKLGDVPEKLSPQPISMTDAKCSISNLPNELLAMVFAYHMIHQLLDVMLVCTMWRDVVYGFPYLWGYLALRADKRIIGALPGAIRITSVISWFNILPARGILPSMEM